MNHITLDSQDEVVKKFVLSLPVDPQGSILELNGRPVMCVLPVSVVVDGDELWTEDKNNRRCDLIDRKYAGHLTPVETIELAQLQEQMLTHRQRVAPLPRQAPAPGAAHQGVGW